MTEQNERPGTGVASSTDVSRREILAAAALSFFLGGTSEAEPVSDDPLCSKCKSTGKIANDKAASLKEDEKNCQFCSVIIAGDPVGVGLDWIPCPDCKSVKAKQKAQDEFERLAKTRRDWLDRQRETEKLVGPTKMMHCETAHFRMTFAIPSISIKKVVYDQHKAMHIYMRRAEDLRTQIMELHGISESEVYGRIKHYLVMFERQVDAKTLAPHVTGLDLSGGAKVFKIGTESSATVSWDDPRFCRTDEDRNQFFDHMVAHHVYHDIKTYAWWLYDKHGWVFEGVAAYWEYRLFGSPRVSCVQEHSGGPIETTHTFEAAVRNAVGAGNTISLANIIDRNCSSLSVPERQFGWSYIDYLFWYDPKAFKIFLTRLLENKIPTRDALKEAYGISLPQLQDRWETWVKAEYSIQDRKGPLVHAPRKVETPDGKDPKKSG